MKKYTIGLILGAMGTVVLLFAVPLFIWLLAWFGLAEYKVHNWYCGQTGGVLHHDAQWENQEYCKYQQ